MSSIEVDFALQKTGPELVEALVSLPEDQWYERKSGRISPKDLARPLIAFANAEGGTIVIGLHDGNLEGISSKSESAFRQASIDFTAPPVRARIQTLDVDGKKLLVMRVEPGDNVHFNKSGDCFLRIGDESRKLSLSEQQELTYDRGSQPYEATTTNLATHNLSQAHLHAYQEAIGSSSVKEMLAARDLTNRQGELTVAAVLLFDDRPQADFPSAYVRIIKYDDDTRGLGSSMTLIEDIRVEGSIPAQITEAAGEIERLIPHRQQLVSSGRFEPVPIIPRDAWLEGLVNAVVHRSYSMMGDHIRVEIFPHRVEISSPGRFPGLVNPTSPLTISRYARNPRIARVCADMGITRELGEGIKRIFNEMRTRGLTMPVYKQTASSVSLILSATDAVSNDILGNLSKSARQILILMQLEQRPLGTGQIADLAGVARPTANRALKALAAAGLIRWNGKSDRDPRASWELL